MTKRKEIIEILVGVLYIIVAWFGIRSYFVQERKPEPDIQNIYNDAAGLYSLRRLNKTYDGPVAKVQRGDGASIDVGVIEDTQQFCLYTTCVVLKMYDQSGNGNHLTKAVK